MGCVWEPKQACSGPGRDFEQSSCEPTHTVVRVMRIPTHLNVARTSTTVAIAIRVMREACREQGDASQPHFRRASESGGGRVHVSSSLFVLAVNSDVNLE